MTDNEKDCTLFLSNLPDKVTESLLSELFNQAGPVDNVSLKKGFGFVTFAHHISVPYSLQLFHGLQLFGRSIVLKPRDGSMYVNQFNQRRQGNSGGQDKSVPSTSGNARQLMNTPVYGNQMRNTSLFNNNGGTPNFNQSWMSNFNNFPNNPNGNFQPQRQNSVNQSRFSDGSDHRGGRQMGRNSVDGKPSSFRGRDQTSDRQSANDGGSGTKNFRDSNPHNWNNSGQSRDFNQHQHQSGSGNMFARRDSQDRRYNDRQSSSLGGNFNSPMDSWSRNSNDRPFRGNQSTPTGQSFDRNSDRNRRNEGFSSQRPDRPNHGSYRPHHNDKPYNRQPNSRYPSEGYSRNNSNKFGRGGRRP